MTGHDSHGLYRIASQSFTSTSTAMKSFKKSLVIFSYSFPLSLSLFHSSFVAKIQILQKISPLNSLPLHPPRLPHYLLHPPHQFKPLSRQTPHITEAITHSPHNPLHSPRAPPFNLQPPKIVDLPPTAERLLRRPSSLSVQTTRTSHRETVLSMAPPNACLSGSN